MTAPEKLALAKELLAEIASAHKDAECAEYNQCDESPCDFCEKVKQILE